MNRNDNDNDNDGDDGEGCSHHGDRIDFSKLGFEITITIRAPSSQQSCCSNSNTVGARSDGDSEKAVASLHSRTDLLGFTKHKNEDGDGDDDMDDLDDDSLLGPPMGKEDLAASHHHHHHQHCYNGCNRRPSTTAVSANRSRDLCNSSSIHENDCYHSNSCFHNKNNDGYYDYYNSEMVAMNNHGDLDLGYEEVLVPSRSQLGYDDASLQALSIGKPILNRRSSLRRSSQCSGMTGASFQSRNSRNSKSQQQQQRHRSSIGRRVSACSRRSTFSSSAGTSTSSYWKIDEDQEACCDPHQQHHHHHHHHHHNTNMNMNNNASNTNNVRNSRRQSVTSNAGESLEQSQGSNSPGVCRMRRLSMISRSSLQNDHIMMTTTVNHHNSNKIHMETANNRRASWSAAAAAARRTYYQDQFLKAHLRHSHQHQSTCASSLKSNRGRRLVPDDDCPGAAKRADEDEPEQDEQAAAAAAAAAADRELAYKRLQELSGSNFLDATRVGRLPRRISLEYDDDDDGGGHHHHHHHHQHEDDCTTCGEGTSVTVRRVSFEFSVDGHSMAGSDAAHSRNTSTTMSRRVPRRVSIQYTQTSQIGDSTNDGGGALVPSPTRSIVHRRGTLDYSVKTSCLPRRGSLDFSSNTAIGKAKPRRASYGGSSNCPSSWCTLRTASTTRESSIRESLSLNDSNEDLMMSADNNQDTNPPIAPDGTAEELAELDNRSTTMAASPVRRNSLAHIPRKQRQMSLGDFKHVDAIEFTAAQGILAGRKIQAA